jgi:predicted Zn finger-like uncharacterized protein
MSTLIICPACQTRYEIAAVLPPEGRKVRCSKCAHVWQATSVRPEPAPMVQAPAVAEPHLPPMPPYTPPPPPPADARGAAAVNPAFHGFAGIARPSPVPTPAPQAPLPEPVLPERPAESAAMDAEFDVGNDFEDDLGGFDLDVPAPRSNGPDFGLSASASETPAQAFEEFAFDAMSDTATAAGKGDIAVGAPKRKPRSAVTIGWGVLALLVAILGGYFVFAQGAVMSMLPGTARLYAMVGMPVNTRGLAFEDLHYEWSAADGQTVLKLTGNIANITGSPLAAPTVVIALRDEGGTELAEWTANLDAPTIAAGERYRFEAEIPSPPETVRSLKVRFAKAE